MQAQHYPNLRPVADTGVLVEFGDAINEATHQQVLSFDAIVRHANINGLTECVPSYTCVLVGYDPLQTDYALVSEQLEKYLESERTEELNPTHWLIPTCYAESLAPDLAPMADQLGVSTDDIIEQHCAGSYKVYMYGFAPGYAYLGGVPEKIQIPRKNAPVMNVPPQTVMVAGQQALITTLPMPTGWWRIGMTTFKPLQIGSKDPFVFNVGDSVEFVAMSHADFQQQLSRH